MKAALPWLVALLGIAAAAYFFNSHKSATAQAATLQQEVHELQPLRAEIAMLKTNVVPPDELARLRKDSEDVLRLRNEVRQLHETKSTLTAQAQSAQAAAQQAQQHAANARAEAAAANQRAAAAPALTPEQELFARRYGIAPTNSPAVDALNACINNLHQINGAKQQWALEHDKPATAKPEVWDVVPYFRNPAMIKCPSGGQYNFGAVIVSPTCSIQGHVLPSQ
jgi:hypothetical protein